jgi:hypothetical protein
MSDSSPRGPSPSVNDHVQGHPSEGTSITKSGPKVLSYAPGDRNDASVLAAHRLRES